MRLEDLEVWKKSARLSADIYRELKNLKGVIPVVDGITYSLVYQNYQDGIWIPIENPSVPGLQYAAFGKPLTENQLKKLSLPMGK